MHVSAEGFRDIKNVLMITPAFEYVGGALGTSSDERKCFEEATPVSQKIDVF